MFKSLRATCAAVVLLACCAISYSRGGPGASTGTWTPLVHQPTFSGTGVPILLTDGSVMFQEVENYAVGSMTNHWYKLTPDADGSYINGTWSQLANCDPTYGPLFYASAVLPDGRVMVQGGEYNLGVNNWTTKGAIYNPVTNSWTNVAPPAGWSLVGDAQCVVLPNGQFMLANILDGRTAFLDPLTLTYSANPTTGKVDRNDEEGWTLLPDGTVLTVDCTAEPNAEKWVPWLGQWVNASATPVVLTSEALGEEMGAAVLRFDGTVLQFGANNHTAIYMPPATPTDPGTWTAGPDMPLGYGQADGPACLLPNGRVLMACSPGLFSGPTKFFETDGVTYDPVVDTLHASTESCFQNTFLVLPNGQVLNSDTSNYISIYTPVGGPQNAWRPTITTAPASVLPSNDYTITGTQFNGLSQTNCYGDDWSNASNYPLVRITNTASGHVFYCRTHDHSTMSVATGGTPVATHFTVPAGIEQGASTIEVVANGIPSASQAIFVGVPNTAPVADAGTDQTNEATGPTTSFTLDGTGSTDADSDPLTYTWYDSSNAQVGTGSTLTLSRAVGTYTFKLTVSDGTNTDDDTVQITIQDTTDPVFGTLPDITVAPTSNAGAVVNFGPFTANDLVDGAITGTASPVSGSTFAVGQTTVNVSATDTAGNTGHASFHVNVTYSWSGFLSPLPKTQVKGGSNIPIKFMLTGASAGITNLVATAKWALVTNGIIGPEHTIGNFVYNNGTYQINWKTPTAKGTYRILAHFGDGSVHTVDVIIK